MSITAEAERRQKEKLLLRPIDWTLSVVLFSFIFGFVFWLEGRIDAAILAGGLIIAMGFALILLFWGYVRIINAARVSR